MTQQDTSYYTDDATLLPAHVLWSHCSQAPLLGPPIFAFFYLRKRLNWPFKATYARVRPDALVVIPADALSPEAQNAFAAHFDCLSSNGYSLAYCAVTPCIGSKLETTATFLAADGQSYVNLVCVQTKPGGATHAGGNPTQTVMGCHSLFADGTSLTSAPLPRGAQMSSILPPEMRYLALPETATLQEVITKHRRQLSLHSPPPPRLDVGTLYDEMLRSAQHFFDHMVNKKFYRRLSDSEVSRLRNISSGP